jgi:hypothetical protein
MFRVVLEAYRALCLLRKRLEGDVTTRLATLPDVVRLQTIPGIGPILAMVILAEARDLRRFGCVRQCLKYCGFDLCTEQSGQFRGTTHLSKRGNARLRYAFWMAGTVAIPAGVRRSVKPCQGRPLVSLTTITRLADTPELDKPTLFLPGSTHPGIEPADPMLTMRNDAYPISFKKRQ